MTSSGRSIASRIARVRRLSRLGSRRALAVEERSWFGPDALINIAAAAASCGAFTESGIAAGIPAFADFPAHAGFWAGLRDLATITAAIDDGGDPAAISDEEEPSDATEPTTRLVRSGDVWRVVA